MIDRNHTELIAKWAVIAEEQRVIFEEIIMDSVNPQRTAYLLLQVTDSAVRCDQINRTIDDALVRRRTNVSFWDMYKRRMFGRHYY